MSVRMSQIFQTKNHLLCQSEASEAKGCHYFLLQKKEGGEASIQVAKKIRSVYEAATRGGVVVAASLHTCNF